MGTKRDSLQQKRAALKKKRREAKRKAQLQRTHEENRALAEDALQVFEASDLPMEPDALRLSSIKVTYDPIESEGERNLPAAAIAQLEALHDLCQTKPNQAIQPLEELKQRYPGIPRIYNYLCAAYMTAGETAKANEIILENYRLNPDYLFAKLNYAGLCLQEGNTAELYKIFDNQFDLGLLYPKRKEFHVSEVVGFYGMMGRFYLATGNKHAAQICHKMINQLDSRHPVTKALTRDLLLSRVQAFFKKK